MSISDSKVANPQASSQAVSSPEEIVFFNNGFVPLSQANLSVKNHSFLYGTSLFEGIRAYWLPEKKQACVFRLREHLERLLHNARIFFMTPEEDIETLIEQTCELVRQNHHEQDFYIRFTLYKDGMNLGPCLDNAKTAYLIWTHPLGNYVPIDKGLCITVSSWRRVDDNAIPPRAKAAGAYMNTALMITEAKRQGFDEVITLTQEGNVSEGSAMNFFMVRNGKVITPARTENILEGITRETLLEIIPAELGIAVEERIIDRTEVYCADEAFFSGTAAQVAPITKIDGRLIGNGEVGEISKKIQALYFDVAKARHTKYQKWCTLV
ncbi:MAG: branched-chain amino acid transaminase [Vampirovibrionales bacterium]|nr:branched-chain amino acid transaminase [Vampirovibrionales bacterium]